jgi:hypothetical protein
VSHGVGSGQLVFPMQRPASLTHSISLSWKSFFISRFPRLPEPA